MRFWLLPKRRMVRPLLLALVLAPLPHHLVVRRRLDRLLRAVLRPSLLQLLVRLLLRRDLVLGLLVVLAHALVCVERRLSLLAPVLMLWVVGVVSHFLRPSSNTDQLTGRTGELSMVAAAAKRRSLLDHTV